MEGVLFLDGVAIGTALDIFDHIHLEPTYDFFPAWVGFFSYEFARHFGLPTKAPRAGVPEAVFYLFTKGSVHAPKATPAPLAPLPYTPVVEVAADFDHAAQVVLDAIQRGDVYQVNLAKCQQFQTNDTDGLNVYHRLRQENPAPFCGLISTPDWWIASASPERLFRLHNGSISARPIAGTRPRGKTLLEDEALLKDLLSCPKERAEHAMLVDLTRNDLAKIADPASIFVSESFSVERYSHVMHLVSEVRGKCEASYKDIFAALFVQGTITGAPKESAMAYIRDLEPQPRGPYTGAMGYFSSGFGADFNILIRTAYKTHNTCHVWAGAGLVAQSQIPREQGEISHKGNSVIKALFDAGSGQAAKPPLLGPKHIRPRLIAPMRQVLFVENHDSFSYNIVNELRCLGAHVTVADHDALPEIPQHITHVVLGPGPKRPEQSGRLLDWLSLAQSRKVAILGICLGHQALGVLHGVPLRGATRVVHGEIFTLTARGKLFAHLPPQFDIVRYNSLVLTDAPRHFRATAHTLDGDIMAIEHDSLPIFGVQFHPESYLCDAGVQILCNFLSVDHAA